MAEKGQGLVTFDIHWISRVCLFVWVMGWNHEPHTHQAQAPLHLVRPMLQVILYSSTWKHSFLLANDHTETHLEVVA